MKRICLRAFIISIAFLIFFVSVPVANAASVTLKTKVSPETVYIGDTITVTVTFTSSDEAIGTLQASLKYDADKMEYISGGGNAVELSNGSGGILDIGSGTEYTMSYSLRFRALKTGKAYFSVTSSEITGFESNKSVGSPTLKTNISINTSNDNSNDLIEITLNGETLYILNDLSDLDLPDGFEVQEISFEGTKAESAYNAAMGLSLLYLLDETSAGSFYIYDSDLNSFSPYISITTDNYYTILSPEYVPEGYSLSTTVIDGMTVPACVSDLNNKEFTLLYAMNSTGTIGYYFYDKADGTMQRVLLDSTTSTSFKAPVALNDTQNTIVICIMAAVCALLAVLTLLLAIKVKARKEKNKF
ncbi:MAG: cohesin domain-containing protein [Eubacteriales bacterium]